MFKNVPEQELQATKLMNASNKSYWRKMLNIHPSFPPKGYGFIFLWNIPNNPL